VRRLLLLAFFMAGCLTLESVTQPASVIVGEHFTIAVTGTHESGAGYYNRAWLALLLPNGFYVDSVCYQTSDSIQGVVAAPDTELISHMETEHPPDSGMRWLVFATDWMTPETSATYRAELYAVVADSTPPGQYLIDYYLGDYGSGSQRIVDSILDQPMTVVDTAVGEDAGMDAILSPVGQIPDTAIIPRARIKNFGGTVIKEVTCYCWIDSLHDTTGTRVYDEDTVYSDPLSPFDTASISFVPPWDPGLQGSYAVTMFTVCQGDSNCANDTLYDTLAVVGIAGDERPNVSAQWCEMLPTQGAIRLRGQEPSAVLDAVGRKVMDLQPGANDIRHLSPGIYFMRQASGVGRNVSCVTKVIVTR
jgi:hypothetical protein